MLEMAPHGKPMYTSHSGKPGKALVRRRSAIGQLNPPRFSGFCGTLFVSTEARVTAGHQGPQARSVSHPLQTGDQPGLVSLYNKGRIVNAQKKQSLKMQPCGQRMWESPYFYQRKSYNTVGMGLGMIKRNHFFKKTQLSNILAPNAKATSGERRT